MSKRNYNDIPPTVKINPDESYSGSYIPPTVKLNPDEEQALPGGFSAPPTVKMPSVDFAPADDFKTIKISNQTPKTLKFIPGYLEMTDGEDKGKKFKIAGYPTPEGNIVTIGREEISGDRSVSHIQLLQRTVSRKQAVLIELKGELYVKNLSEINPTQLNGKNISVGNKRKLKDGDKIRLGEIELMYKID